MPPLPLRLPLAVLLSSLLLTLLCGVNLLVFHNHQALFLEKFAFHTARKRMVQSQDLIHSVSRVQNQLTDISATLGLDHQDQGFVRARSAMEEFLAGLVNLGELLNTFPRDDQTPTQLPPVHERFVRFYTLGIEMAHAYIGQGTFQGNQKMKLFDSEADGLRATLNDILTRHETEHENWRLKVRRHPEAFTTPSGLSNLVWFYLMGKQARAHYVQSMTELTQSASANQADLPLSLLAQELQGLALHIQQWLTDLGATRGQDGLDEGREHARQAAERFHALLPLLNQRVAQSDHPEFAERCLRLGPRFDRFYAQGMAMAEAYIHKGTRAGNPLMAEFDRLAEEIEAELAPLITPALEDVGRKSFHLELIQDSLDEIRVILWFVLFFLMSSTMASAVWLYSCKSRFRQTR